MRTTIELADDQRNKLRELAARRGDTSRRGCAKIVQEAVAHYLAEQERPPATRADRLWIVFGWVWEEVAGLLADVHAWRGRLRGSPAGTS